MLIVWVQYFSQSARLSRRFSWLFYLHGFRLTAQRILAHRRLDLQIGSSLPSSLIGSMSQVANVRNKPLGLQFGAVKRDLHGKEEGLLLRPHDCSDCAYLSKRKRLFDFNEIWSWGSLHYLVSTDFQRWKSANQREYLERESNKTFAV